MQPFTRSKLARRNRSPAMREGCYNFGVTVRRPRVYARRVPRFDSSSDRLIDSGLGLCVLAPGNPILHALSIPWGCRLSSLHYRTSSPPLRRALTRKWGPQVFGSSCVQRGASTCGSTILLMSVLIHSDPPKRLQNSYSAITVCLEVGRWRSRPTTMAPEECGELVRGWARTISV